MFLEFLSHAISLDFQWIAELVLNNLLWVFLLAAYVFINHDGKHWLWKFILLVGSLYILLDIAGIWKLAFAPIMLIVFFVISLEFFAEGNALSRHKTAAIWIVFFVASFIYAFFW